MDNQKEDYLMEVTMDHEPSSSTKPPIQEQAHCSKQEDTLQLSRSKPLKAKRKLKSYSDASPDMLREMFTTHGILVFLNVPEGTEFGIDYMTWTIGSKFKGVKMIPTGVHFIHYTAINRKYREKGIRTGFFHMFTKGEVLVKKWDASNEDISDEAVSDEELHRVTTNLMEMDRYLGPYPIEKHREWQALSSYITPGVVERVQPENGRICSAPPLLATGRLDSEGLPEMRPVEGSEIRFSTIPMLNHPLGASPGEVSRHNMDRSYALATLLQRGEECAPAGADSEMELLGEIQFAFVCFLIGEQLSALEAWKSLVQLVCNCQQALLTHPRMYHALINVLHYQVREIPADFFVDIVTGNNFLVVTLHNFFQGVADNVPDIERALCEKCDRFREYLTDKFNWDFTSEPDEYAPTVVETQ